jgi:hypothetical protein
MPEWSGTYSEVMLEQYGFPAGWIPNWPPGKNRKLGDVGSIEKPGFNEDGVLKNYDVAVPPTAVDEQGAGPLSLSSRKSITVEIGTDASVPAWNWIGQAKAGVKVGFGDESGMIMGVGSSQYEIFEDLDKLRAELIKAGRDKKMPIGRSVIIERLVAANGLLLISSGGAGTIQATTTFDAGVGALTLASFAVGFSANTQQAGFVSQAFPNGFCVAFRVITLGKRGWLFFRRVAIYGFDELSIGQRVAALENGTTADDYFAAFPDADFTTGKGPILIEGDDSSF